MARKHDIAHSENAETPKKKPYKKSPKKQEIPEGTRRRPGRHSGSKEVSLRRDEMTRRGIVEASAKVFAENGYGGTTMEEIAKEAGFSPSSLYGYFPSKEALYLFLLGLLSGKVTQVFEDPFLEDLSFFDRVSWVLRRLFLMVEQSPELFEILIQGLRVGPKTSASIVAARAQIEASMLASFAHQLEVGQAEGCVVQCDVEELACLLKGAFQAWLARWRLGFMPEGLQESFPRFRTLITPMLEGKCPHSEP